MKRWFLMLTTALLLTGCGYNDFQRLDEQTKSAWSEVLNQYQRRTDLVPNIVATVKGEANFEQETLTKVIEARAKATSIQVTPETLNNPEAFAKFQAAQGELGSALSRLMVTVEQYPNLKANQGFRDLRVQLGPVRPAISRLKDAIVAGSPAILLINEIDALEDSLKLVEQGPMQARVRSEKQIGCLTVGGDPSDVFVQEHSGM